MIGIVLVTHGRLAEEMVRTLEGVLGRVPQLEALCDLEADPGVVAMRIRRKIERVETGDGVLILTDMLGDTATNVSLTVAEACGAEVVAGVNMPMLVKAAAIRGDQTLRELAAFIGGYGRDHIFWASERSRSPEGTARR